MKRIFKKGTLVLLVAFLATLYGCSTTSSTEFSDGRYRVPEVGNVVAERDYAVLLRDGGHYSKATEYFARSAQVQTKDDANAYWAYERYIDAAYCQILLGDIGSARSLVSQAAEIQLNTPKSDRGAVLEEALLGKQSHLLGLKVRKAIGLRN